MKDEYFIYGFAIWATICLSLLGFGVWVIIKLLQYWSII